MSTDADKPPICHRFTAAMITGRAVVSAGVQAYNRNELADMSLPCIGRRCALWVPDLQVPGHGQCADNMHARPRKDPGHE